MARSGTHVDESIDCRGTGRSVVVERLLEVAGADYRPVQVGPVQYRFSRSYRPTWSVVVGWLLLPLLVGLLVWLYKRSETWDASVEEDHTGTRLQVSGRVLPATLVRLRDALRGSRPARSAPSSPAPPVPAVPLASVPREVPVPVSVDPASPAPPSVAAPSSGPPPTAPPVPSPPPPPVPSPPPPRSPLPPSPPPPPPSDEVVPVPPPASVASGAEAPTVVVRGGPRPDSIGAGAVLVLSFDTGETRMLTGPITVGRDPSTAGEGGDHLLVRVPDPDFSVSKSHVSLFPEGPGQVTVVDRGSTNGTAVEDERGNLFPVVPGAPVTARAGQTIRFGKRAILISEERG